MSDKRINYSDITWFEEPDVFAIGQKRVDLCTKQNEIFSIYYPRHLKVADFLRANTRLAKEKPAILTLDMDTMTGEKIRCQYFNAPIYGLSIVHILEK